VVHLSLSHDGEIRYVLLPRIFCYNEAKAGHFVSRKQFWNFSVKHFLLYSYNFFAIMIFFASIKEMRDLED
jgi:hypothetical protein